MYSCVSDNTVKKKSPSARAICLEKKWTKMEKKSFCTVQLLNRYISRQALTMVEHYQPAVSYTQQETQTGQKECVVHD